MAADTHRSGLLVRRARQAAARAVLVVPAAVLAVALAITMVTLGSLGEVTPLDARVSQAAEGSPPLDQPAVPVRIRVPGLGIDLAVVSSELNVRGNTRDYPLCDVAQYWTIYDLPGAPGTTWIYAHAQAGMFLPLFLSADATDGAGLLGKVVTLQLRDGRSLRYRIDEVKQHAYNRRIALRPRPTQHRLVLQTSEGPPGTIPKLQVAARLVGAGWTSEPPPKANPRACWQPRTTTSGSAGGNKNDQQNRTQASPAPASAGSADTADPIDGATLAVGGGAVLLGSLLFATYLVRRPPAGQGRSAGPPHPPVGQQRRS